MKDVWYNIVIVAEMIKGKGEKQKLLGCRS